MRSIASSACERTRGRGMKTYPIDRPQLSAVISFGRAKGRCEACQHPHGCTVYCLGDGRRWDDEAASCRDGSCGMVCIKVDNVDVLGEVRTTRVVLATGHRKHDTADKSSANLAAWCQRCHMLHDAPEHRRRRWVTLFQRKALGDLFRGP